MGMSAGDEKRIQEESARAPGMFSLPAAWLRELMHELEYYRGYVAEQHCGEPPGPFCGLCAKGVPVVMVMSHDFPEHIVDVNPTTGQRRLAVPCIGSAYYRRATKEDPDDGSPEEPAGPDR